MLFRSPKKYFIYENYILPFLTKISPKLNTQIYYRIRFGEPINLKKPKGLNEKICWLKLNLYNKNKLVHQCADKYRVRAYIKKKGLEYTLPHLYGVYNTTNEIEWEKLPNKFVIKLNCGCGMNIICSDYNTLDKEKTIRQLKKWEKSSRRYYQYYSEMQYKNVPCKILIEKFIETKNGKPPADYKFFCFHGEPKCLLYCTERIGEHVKRTFFDMNGKILNIIENGVYQEFPNPTCYNEMLKVCKILSSDFPFVRVDLYDNDGHVLFGELTFTPLGGTEAFTAEGNLLMGSWLSL